MNRVTPLAICALGAWVSLAGAERANPPTALCARILEGELETPGSTARRASLPRWSELLERMGRRGEVPVPPAVECELEESGAGALRVRWASVGGRELSEGRLALINADLLLHGIRRAAPGAARGS